MREFSDIHYSEKGDLERETTLEILRRPEGVD